MGVPVVVRQVVPAGRPPGGETVGVEEVAAVRLNPQFVVVHAAVHGAAGGQEAVPSGCAGLKDLGVLEAFLLERLPQGANCVEILVVPIVDREEPLLLLGDEEEDDAHHDGDSRFVHVVRFDAGQQGSAPIPVGTRDGVRQQLGGSPHLGAELVGDLGLRAGGLDKQRLGSVPLGRAEESPRMQHRSERIQQNRLGGELRRSPGAPAGGAASRRVDKREVVPVGDQREGDTVVPTRQGRALHPGRGPRVAGRTGPGIGPHGEREHQHARPGGRRIAGGAGRWRFLEQADGSCGRRLVDAGRRDGDVVSGDTLSECGGQFVACQVLGSPAENVAQ